MDLLTRCISLGISEFRSSARHTKVAFFVLLLLVASARVSDAATTTFSDEASFLAALPASTTYDFETASGFPEQLGSPYPLIGLRDGILFSASVLGALDATSGVQSMTGNPDTFSPASLDFTGTANKPFAIGFYGLDLQEGEVIRLTVNYTGGGSEVFDVGLGGAPSFTPIYFGLHDSVRTFDSLTLLGADEEVTDRAWLIDDLTLARVPEPSTWLMLTVGLILAGGGTIARRRR